MPIHRPIPSAISHPLTSAVTEGAGGFSVLSMFAAGEQGGVYDASRLDTLFSDAAGTTPAVVDGVVGRQLDLSGRGNHRTQATTASKPILRTSGGLYWLEYDGVDDFLSTASIDLTPFTKLTVWTGIRKASDSATGVLIEQGGGAAPGFAVFAPFVAANTDLSFRSGGTALITNAYNAQPAPITAVVCGIGDISGDVAQTRVNGVANAVSTGDQGTGGYRNGAVFFGRRSGTSLPFTGREYITIIRAAASSASQISSTERLVSAKCGVTI